MVAFPVYIFRKGLRRIPSPAKFLQACELYLLDQYAKLTLMEDTSWEQWISSRQVWGYFRNIPTMLKTVFVKNNDILKDSNLFANKEAYR